MADSATMQDDSQGLITNLDNYIALGCIVLKDENLNFPINLNEVAVKPSNCFPNLTADVRECLSILSAANWVRCSLTTLADGMPALKIYTLPHDLGRRFVDRTKTRLIHAMEKVMAKVHICPSMWVSGKNTDHIPFMPWAIATTDSLFYMFNKLPSPNPDPSLTANPYARLALTEFLEGGGSFPGLNTILYPYQRRTIAEMLQRETTTRLQQDPRLEKRTAPDGRDFFYNPREKLFLKEPTYYESCRGGVLAETMGHGKTLMCLALITATLGQMPSIPEPYNPGLTVRPTVGSLKAMAAAAIQRSSIPWRSPLQGLDKSELEVGNFTKEIHDNVPVYEIPREPVRFNRKTEIPPPLRPRLCATTIVVVPRNLCAQWCTEIEKHVEKDLLKLLVMDDTRQILPPVEQLETYDVILFSKTRFEAEIRDGSDDSGRREFSGSTLSCTCPYIGATRIRDCTCLRFENIYQSPLKKLHFLRIIIDEGHSFATSNSNAVIVASRLVNAERRWIVSGTPAKDLLGVELDLSGQTADSMTDDATSSREATLAGRKRFSKREDRTGAAKALGHLATNFLQLQPFASSSVEESPADWDDCVYVHEDFKKKTYTCFSECMVNILNGMVIRTRPEDVERDIVLPPLHQKVVRLEPSLYDKMTANLFIQVLTANAVTSERTDVDYLFHPRSQKARNQLVANLRQSNFFWTGFSVTDVEKSIQHGTDYLTKENITCSVADRDKLNEAMILAKRILSCKGWKSLSISHEIGLFINGWPIESQQHWTFDSENYPLLCGVLQLLQAKEHVDGRLATPDPLEALPGLGIRTIAAALTESQKNDKSSKENENLSTNGGIPASSLSNDTIASRQRRTATGTRSRKSSSTGTSASPTAATHLTSPINGKRKRSDSTTSDDPVQPLSPFVTRPKIIGTTSAKLSYLLDQCLEHHETEKIIIFYDGDNIAFYLAQALELLDIKHLIYAKTLNAKQKSEYIVHFDTDSTFRVLIMDVKQASHGLHLSSASRVYFVNPVCSPNTEAQAVKRAHRIGQTRPVHVETLLLKGTLEEKMYERAKNMSRLEHGGLKNLDDDTHVARLIQTAGPIPIAEDEWKGFGQVAHLKNPQQLFARPNRGAASVPLPKNSAAASIGDVPPVPKKPRAKPTKGQQRSPAPRKGLTNPRTRRIHLTNGTGNGNSQSTSASPSTTAGVAMSNAAPDPSTSASTNDNGNDQNDSVGPSIKAAAAMSNGDDNDRDDSGAPFSTAGAGLSNGVPSLFGGGSQRA